MKEGFSIIICTYNPEDRILSRCLSALQKLKAGKLPFEIIIVNNNSNNNFENKAYIKQFLKNIQNSKIVTEMQQGLVYARIKGFQNSLYNTIIFVDDDNELDSKYILETENILIRNSSLGVLGPGTISIDFIDETTSIVKKYFKEAYQDRHFTKFEHGKKVGWENYYPVGSGMIIRRNIFEIYCSDFHKGKLSSIGRKGEELSSAEDSQIVWTSILQNFSVGSHPSLKLIHIIPQRRTTIKYLCSLNYNVSKSYYKAFYEMFPEKKELFRHNLLSPVNIFIKALKTNGYKPKVVFYFFKYNYAWYKGYKSQE